jgi:hypothetical protein
MAVLASIKPYVQSALFSGRRVVFDDLGSFVISIRSMCFHRETMQDKEFTPSSMIREYDINSNFG